MSVSLSQNCHPLESQQQNVPSIDEEVTVTTWKLQPALHSVALLQSQHTMLLILRSRQFTIQLSISFQLWLLKSAASYGPANPATALQI